MGKHVELLMDDADTPSLGVPGVGDRNPSAVDQDIAGVRSADASDDPGECALAGSILADERVYLAGADAQRCTPERLNAVVMLMNVVSGDEITGHGACHAVTLQHPTGDLKTFRRD